MNQEGSDVMFRVENQVLPAHKVVLRQKSKYFDGLFNSHMTESRQHTIEITDCKYPVFRGLHLVPPFLLKNYRIYQIFVLQRSST